MDTRGVGDRALVVATVALAVVAVPLVVLGLRDMILDHGTGLFRLSALAAFLSVFAWWVRSMGRRLRGLASGPRTLAAAESMDRKLRMLTRWMAGIGTVSLVVAVWSAATGSDWLLSAYYAVGAAVMTLMGVVERRVVRRERVRLLAAAAPPDQRGDHR